MVIKMKISSVEVKFFSVPYKILKNPKKIHALVNIRTDEGVFGTGEVNLSPSWEGETQASVESVIKELITPVLIGKDPFDIQAIKDEITKVVGGIYGAGIYGQPMAKAAIDYALHDLMGKALGIPVYKLLGGCYRRKIPIAYAVLTKNWEELSSKEVAELACNAVEKGFKTFKLYVMHPPLMDPKEDIERVKAVRDAVGYEIDLRVDASGVWDRKMAIQTIRKMEKYELQYVEQPVAGWDFDGMSIVARAVDTKISADESVFTPQDALRLVEKKAVDIINIKVSRVGGIFNAEKINAIAESAGVACMIGAMLELELGTAASAHLAASKMNVRYPCELVGPLWYEEDYWITKEGFKVEDGFYTVPEKAGLGLELDEAKLAKLIGG